MPPFGAGPSPPGWLPREVSEMTPRDRQVARGPRFIGAAALVVASMVASAGIAHAQILNAKADFVADEITINGQNFRTSPVGRLNGVALGVLSSGAAKIVASLENLPGLETHPGD